MQQQIHAFVEAHPRGWSHDDWLGLVAALRHEGFDVSDPASVGLKLENERLAQTLQRLGVSGLGPKRSEAIVNRFGTLWRLRHTNAEELAEIKTISSALAERVVESLRGAEH